MNGYGESELREDDQCKKRKYVLFRCLARGLARALEPWLGWLCNRERKLWKADGDDDGVRIMSRGAHFKFLRSGAVCTYADIGRRRP